MESIANMLVATVNLVEAEGRTLRRQLVRLGIATAMILCAAALAIIGVGFLLYGLQRVLAEAVSAPVAAAVFGGVALALAGGLLWTVRKLVA